jgi:DNA-binding transcriptional ArsR family regulator
MLKTEALKKTEKIASAAYLVTGFFDDKEPLKWKLRMLASKLVSASIFLKDSSGLKEEKFARDIEKLLLEMTSLLVVARSAGLISEVNQDIFQKEIEKFIEVFIDASSATQDPNSPVLSESFFSVPREKNRELPSPTVSNVDRETESLDESRDRVSPRELRAPRNIDRDTDSVKDKFLPRVSDLPKVTPSEAAKKPVSEGEKDKKLRDFGTVAVKKNARQSVIINLLKRKREIMIKDVAPLIEGVSEKTIQRELLAMVEQGIVKKEGEKRWSRYSLA